MLLSLSTHPPNSVPALAHSNNTTAPSVFELAPPLLLLSALSTCPTGWCSSPSIRGHSTNYVMSKMTFMWPCNRVPAIEANVAS
jgi:hypothetical protein